MYQQSKQQMATDNGSSAHVLMKENIKKKIFIPVSSSSLCTLLVYWSSAQWRAVNWHWLLHVSRTPIEQRLPCSLSAAQRAQRQLGLKRLPQSMNTNGIDLYLHFLQGDLWTFIAEEEPRPLCVLNCLKWWKSSRSVGPSEALQFCQKLSNLVSLWSATGEYNGSQVDWKKKNLIEMLVWKHVKFTITEFWWMGW